MKKCKIYIADIVANAFIPYLQQTEKRALPLHKIELFGEKVVDYLNNQGYATDLVLSRNSTHQFFNQYSNFFELIENGPHNNVVALANDNITCDDLICEFRGYLPLPVLLAFMNRENIQILFDE